MAYIGGKLAPWFDSKPNDTAMRNMVRVAIHKGKEIAEANTPIDTGDLRAHWMVTEHISRTMTFLGAGWKGEWYNGLDYAVYVDQGTGLWGPEHRKYLILPKTPGGTLHWVDGATGGDVYAKAVLHPGSPGQHMIAISANVVEASWTGLCRGPLRNWAREVEHQNPWATLT